MGPDVTAYASIEITKLKIRARETINLPAPNNFVMTPSFISRITGNESESVPTGGWALKAAPPIGRP